MSKIHKPQTPPHLKMSESEASYPAPSDCSVDSPKTPSPSPPPAPKPSRSRKESKKASSAKPKPKRKPKKAEPKPPPSPSPSPPVSPVDAASPVDPASPPLSPSPPPASPVASPSPVATPSPVVTPSPKAKPVKKSTKKPEAKKPSKRPAPIKAPSPVQEPEEVPGSEDEGEDEPVESGKEMKDAYGMSDAEEDATPVTTPPPKRKRGRPPKSKDTKTKTDTNAAPKRKKPAKEDTVSVDRLYEEMEKLPRGVKARIIFDQPALFTRVNNGLSDLIECPQFALSGQYLCVDMQDDDNFAIVTLRLECRTVVDDDAFDTDETVYFCLDTKRLAAGLKNIRNFQTCSIELNESDHVDIIAQNNLTAGNLTVIKLQNVDMGEYEPVGMSDIKYTWHIVDMDVQDFQTLVQTAAAYNSKHIRFQFYQIGDAEDEYILAISTGEAEARVFIYQHICLKPESDEKSEKAKTDEEEASFDPSTVYCASSDTVMTQDEMRKYTGSHDPCYDHNFSSRYLLRFLKATENKCIMTLHFNKDGEDESGRIKHWPMVLRYRLGDDSSRSYLKFTIGPVKQS